MCIIGDRDRESALLRNGVLTMYNPFDIPEPIDAEFDEPDTALINSTTGLITAIEPDPRDDYSWLPLNRWDDRKLNTT